MREVDHHNGAQTEVGSNSGAMSEVDSYTCVTCSDKATPVRILCCRQPGSAEVELEGERAEIDVQLVGTVNPGDMVLVHQGVAISRLSGDRLPDVRDDLARLFPDLAKNEVQP